MNKPMRAKCAKCHDIVEVSRYGEYKALDEIIKRRENGKA